jgi:hypothetical protein
MRTAEVENTLAVKTGDLRGAVKGGQALARSCAGQQNLRSNSVSASMPSTFESSVEMG